MDRVIKNLNALKQWLQEDQGIGSRKRRAKNQPKPKKPNSTYFWDHLLQIKSIRDLPKLNKFARALAADASLEKLFSDLPVTMEMPKTTDTRHDIRNAISFNAAVNLMQAVHDRNAQNNLLLMLLHIFFFVTSHPDWAHSSRKRLSHVNDRKCEYLYDNYLCLVRRYAPDVPVMARAKFLAEISNWVSVGSKYAFIASQLSLGSLVHLQHLLTPAAMRGCSKGNERAKMGGISLSEHTLAHLRSIGLVERAESANLMMHALLWALVGHFRIIQEPRAGNAKFPGFG